MIKDANWTKQIKTPSLTRCKQSIKCAISVKQLLIIDRANVIKLIRSEFDTYNANSKTPSRGGLTLGLPFDLSKHAFKVLQAAGYNTFIDLLGLSYPQFIEIIKQGELTIPECLSLIKPHERPPFGRDAIIKTLFLALPLDNFQLPLKQLFSPDLYARINQRGFTSLAQLVSTGVFSSYRLLPLIDNELIKVSRALKSPCLKMVNDRFNDVLYPRYSTGIRENAERNILMLRRLSVGQTLNAATADCDLTRERLRQIKASKVAEFSKFINDHLVKATLHSWADASNLLFYDKIHALIAANADLFIFLLREGENPEITDCPQLNAFILGRNWRPLIEEEIARLPDVIRATQTKKLSLALALKLRRAGFKVDSRHCQRLIEAHYKVNGIMLAKRKITITHKCRIVLETYYPEGIQVYNPGVLEQFRKQYVGLFGEKCEAGMRALAFRIIDNCILVGRGKYMLKQEHYVTPELLKEIFDFILNYKYETLFYTTILVTFETQLAAYGVDNRYFLQGIIRQQYELWRNQLPTLYFRKDYISRNPEQISIVSIIIEFIKKHSPVTAEALKAEFVGVADCVFLTAFTDRSIIPTLNGKYYHRDRLKMNEQARLKLEAILTSLCANDQIIDDETVFRQLNRQLPELVKQNGITTPPFAFSICSALFHDQFNFRRPFIAASNVTIEGQEDRLKAFIAQHERLTITALNDYAKANSLLINSMNGFINDLIPDYLRIDSHTLCRADQIKITASKIAQIEDYLISLMAGAEALFSFALTSFSALPDIAVAYTPWLLGALIKAYGDRLKVIDATSDYRASLPVFVTKESEIDDLAELYERSGVTVL